MGKSQTPNVVESISFWLLDKEEEVPTETRTKKIELIVLQKWRQILVSIFIIYL